jgi:hypothetical protein
MIGRCGSEAVMTKMKASEVGKRLTKICQMKHLENIQKSGGKGHSLRDLEGCPISNFFIGNCHSPTSDAVVKFAIRARTNNLPTEANLYNWGKRNSGSCLKCGNHGTLVHRINSCRPRFQLMTKRHDDVVELIARMIEAKQNGIILHRNSTIRIPSQNMQLSSEVSNLRPDLWFVTPGEKKLTLVEVTVPYGSRTKERSSRDDDEEEDEDGPILISTTRREVLRGQEEDSEKETATLEIRRRDKVEKYQKLIEECERKLDYEVELLVVVISSLGAIPKETMNDLRKLAGFKGSQTSKTERQKLNLWAKRMVIASLKGSLAVWRDIHDYRGVGNSVESPYERSVQNEMTEVEAMHSQLLEELNEEVDDSSEREVREEEENNEDRSLEEAEIESLKEEAESVRSEEVDDEEEEGLEVSENESSGQKASEDDS